MKVVIVGNYGAGNLGDELILEGVMNSLEPFVKNENITVLSGNPQETKKLHQVNSCAKFPAGVRSLIKSIFDKKSQTALKVKECDYFILGGGGLFGNLTFKSNLIWGMQSFMAYKYKKKVIMYGQSIGPLTNPLTKALVKWLFKKATLIVVRDKQSQKRLEEAGVKAEIHILPDFIFSINDSSVRRKKHSNQSDKKKLLLTLRQLERTPEKTLKQISFFLQWLQELKNWEIKILNFQDGSGPDNDGQVHQKIVESLKNKPATITLDLNNSKSLFSTFEGFDLVLGMRLHSILTAIKTRTPFIALSYAEKISDILEDADLKGDMLQIEDLKTYQLKEKFTKITGEMEKQEAILNYLNEKFSTQHENFQKKILIRLFKPR